jgi:FkbM family methyltransferase
VGDVASVCRTTSPTTATRWLAALLARLPECARSRSLQPADRTWARSGASFRTSSGAVVSLPAEYTPGAREMYCRDVYLRSGLRMPSDGWVIDLGANRGLFSVWAAVTGAQVVAVEAQQGFAAEIQRLAAHNGVSDRVHVEIALASGAHTSGATVGVVANDHRWATTSHGAATRPADVSVPQLMSAHQIERVGLMKVDIEGGEFAVFADENLHWLKLIDQLVFEIHPDFGDVALLIDRIRYHGFVVDLRDNDGTQVDVTCPTVEYAYCSRR